MGQRSPDWNPDRRTMRKIVWLNVAENEELEAIIQYLKEDGMGLEVGIGEVFRAGLRAYLRELTERHEKLSKPQAPAQPVQQPQPAPCPNLGASAFV